MAEEKFLLVSLKEDEAKHLAQVISNDTSRKILDLLSTTKDATESDIAKNLNVPLSTVHYNISALVKARLVQVDEFHYSEKGKEVNHYSLANKYVIIAPGKTDESFISKLRSILPVALIVAIGAGLFEFFTRLFQKSTLALNYSMPFASKAMSPGMESVGSGAYDTVMIESNNYAQEEVVRAVPQAVADNAPQMLKTAVGYADQALINVSNITNNISQNAIDAVNYAGDKMMATNIEPTQFPVSDIAVQHHNIFLYPGLIFLYGAIFAIIVYLIIDMIAKKKKN